MWCVRAGLTSWSLPRFLKLRRRPLFSLVGVEGILERFWLQIRGQRIGTRGNASSFASGSFEMPIELDCDWSV